jgi:hypothetical protein
MNEKQLFNLIKTKLIKDLQPTDEMNHKDGYSPKLDMSIEFKCRTRHFDTILMEKKKYEELMRFSKGRYIVSTPEGIFSWNVKKLKNIVWVQKELPTTTMYFREVLRELKTITMLNIKDAKNITNILLC